MGHGDVPPPFYADARYEQLTGGPGNRALHYLAKRRLNMSVAEWDALPWYDQRMYMEGFVEEGLLSTGDDHDVDMRDPIHGGEFSEEGPKHDKHNPDQPKRVPSIPGVDPVMTSTEQLKRLGLKVIDGGGV